MAPTKVTASCCRTSLPLLPAPVSPAPVPTTPPLPVLTRPRPTTRAQPLCLLPHRQRVDPRSLASVADLSPSNPSGDPRHLRLPQVLCLHSRSTPVSATRSTRPARGPRADPSEGATRSGAAPRSRRPTRSKPTTRSSFPASRSRLTAPSKATART